jgi:putative oxidoreductase
VTEGPLLDVLGRGLIFGYFLVAGLCNLTKAQVRSHIDRMRDLGTPLPQYAFWIGLAIQFTGCALLLTARYAAVGAALLLFFTIVATAIFHRFWNHTDPQRRNVGRINLLNNIAISGGLLLLMQDAMR